MSESTNNEILIGKNAVLEALKADREINKVMFSSDARLNEINSRAKDKKIPVQKVSKSKLDQLSGNGKHQGVIAMVSPKEYIDFDQLVDKSFRESQEPILIILDELEDPHNFGAILRTAEAAGAQGVVIPKRRSVPLTQVVAKASAGALEYMPVARVSNLVNAIKELQQRGYWVVGTDASGSKTHTEVDLKGPIALVIGSEGKGMGRLVKETCDFVAKLPMRGSINSLNASVAAGVVIYEALRQRQGER
ncbi:23S rRNA (guanosine2251-2'-O)-methyltransferase [Desulfitispora alkaliphila]|uniref:23S rRNA (guanosine(2251)-2'-O)-methyltransferase RlmB n=1 Tax=Desulfitispora alkaliphila TaxID=622674 RepID=UPI003D1C90DC